MKPEIEAKIRKHFETIVHMAEDDRRYVLDHMYAYLCGIDAMGGFYYQDEFAKAMNNLEGWFYFGTES